MKLFYEKTCSNLCTIGGVFDCVHFEHCDDDCGSREIAIAAAFNFELITQSHHGYRELLLEQCTHIQNETRIIVACGRQTNERIIVTYR